MLRSLSWAKGPDGRTFQEKCPGLLQEPLQLFHELSDIPELPVDGREPHIRYLVELVQFMHRELAYLSGGHLPVVLALEVALDIVDELFDALDADAAASRRPP